MQTTRKVVPLFTFVALLFGYDAGAITLTTTNVMGSAPTAWTNAIWKTNLTDAFTNGVAPVAGNAYVAIGNGVVQAGNGNTTRIRPPAVDAINNFPGDSLTIQTNAEIRFKRGTATGTAPFVSPTISRFPGVGGNPGLILDGGLLNPGDDVIFPIAGSVRVATDSILGLGDGGIVGLTPSRGFQITASLSGTGSVIIAQGVTNFANVDVTSANNSYSGTWVVKAGWLKGSGVGSLGPANVTLDVSNAVSTALITSAAAAGLSNGPVRFEVNYDLDSPGTLTVARGDAQLVLHQNIRFAKLFVDGNPIPNGTYTYADIVANFPNHIVGGGSGTVSVGPATPSGLTAIPGDTQVQLSWTGSSGATGYAIYRSLSSGLSTNGTSIFTNGTSTTFTDTGLANGTPYYYVVSAINAGGESTNSVEATATPGQYAPIIAVDVVGATNCTGSSVTFSVVSTNTFPVFYQWYYNGTTLLPNQTNSTYTSNNLQVANSGTYSVVITNNFGSVTSSLATLLVKQVTVASGPANQTNCPGTPVTFTTTASGAGTLTYTWRKGATVLQGPNGNNTYSIASVAAGDAGQYSVTVVGDCNSVSNSFVFVVAPAPIITVQPKNIIVPAGNGTVFSVTALTTNGGVAPLSYQWKTNGIDVTGATASTFAISNLTLAANGLQVSVGVTNCAGGLLSSAATLTVRPVFGISFDFNTPGQWTNAPYNWVPANLPNAVWNTQPGTVNDWFNFGAANNTAGNNPASMGAPAAGGAQVQTVEVPFGGVGGSGGLGHVFNNNIDSGALLLPVGYDFSSSGKVLNASIMIKLRNPQTVARNTHIGFVTTTNYNNQWQGINGNDQQGYMSAIFQNAIAASSAQGNFRLEFQHKVIAGTATLPSLQTVANSPSNALSTNNWYRFNVQFVNVKGTGLDASNFLTTASVQDMGLDGLTPGPIQLAFSNVLGTNIDIVNQTNLFFCLRNASQQAGLEMWDNIFINTTNGPIFFAAPVTSASALENRTATFRAMVDGDGPYQYQWYKDGNAISGARNWRYTTGPLLLSDNGAQITVVVSNLTMSITSSPVTLTVTADPLQLVSVGSVDGGVIGVRFNERVNPANATVPGNYLVNGVAALGASLRPNGSDVLIVPASIISGAYTVTVASVTTPSGTALGASVSATGRVENLTGYDVDANTVGWVTPSITEVLGNNGAVPVYPGESYSYAAGEFDITAGGHDIFSGFDGFRYVYKQVTGDFDVKMRAIWQDPQRFSQKVGFNARISLDAFSPNVGVWCDAPYPQLNKTEGTARILWGGAGSSWGTNTAVVYPNAWIRFRRSGQTFLRYSSTNGVNWLCDGQVSPQSGGQAWPATLYLGIGANDNVGTGAVQPPAHSQVDNYGDFAGYPGAVISITTQPTANPSVAAGASATLTVVATATVVPQSGLGGELSYIWQKTNSAVAGGWTNLPNAGITNATLTTAALFGIDQNTHFRVIVTAPGATPVTSTASRITITDAAAPTIATTAVVAPSNSVDKIYITFSEFVSAATALNKANYLVTNGAGQVFGIASIAFNWTAGDQRAVIITTSNALPTDFYGVFVSGVQDQFGNAIAAVTRTFRQWSSYPFAGPVEMDVYQGLASGGVIADLTNNVRFLNNSPDYVQYSNIFSWNPASTSQTGPQDNYGVRMFSYFVPTQSLQYTFWWKADDFAVFSMNTNASPSVSTNPSYSFRTFGPVLTANNPNYAIQNTVTTPQLTAGQKYYIEFCFKETGGGDHGSVFVTTGTTNGVTAPANTLVMGSDLLMFPTEVAPVLKVMVEQYTNQLYSGMNLFPGQAAVGNGNKSELVLSTNTLRYISGIPDMFGYQSYSGFYTNLGQSGSDNYLGKFYTYFVPPTNGNYKFWIRGDDANQLFMNTNAVNSTDPAGKNFLVEIPQFYNVNYLSNTTVTLVGGQRYYLEGIWREGGGGDGMTVAVRSGADTAVPTPGEMIPASMLEFPTNLIRVGAVNFNGAGSKGGIAPVSPTVSEGQAITFFAQGVCGAAPYFFTWLKNGQIVEAAPPINGANGAVTAPFYRTLPLTLADNGAIYSLVVSNFFSVVTQSTTITVTADTTPPTIASAVGSQFGNLVTLTFDEEIDPFTASQVARYQINGGVSVLAATYDYINKNRVTLRTTPQTAGQQYTVTVNGVRDISAAGNPTAGAMKTFSAWGFGGIGTLYVEYWTNLLGSAYGALENTPQYILNRPDGAYYTNVFIGGQFGAETGRNFWGERITGLFMPPSNGLYRFYVRADDGSKLFMNTNGPDASGAVIIASSLGANSGTYYNGQGPLGANNSFSNGVVGYSFSSPISLTNGTPYFIQAIFKEGTGGDHLEVVFRGVDQNGVDYPALGTPAVGDAISGGFFQTTGNPDINQFLISSQPPAELFVFQSDPVFLELVANTIPANLSSFVSYQWQKTNAATGTFTNIPGATTASLFFYANIADDGATYRLVASIPGKTLILPTLLHVSPDTIPPMLVSVSSLDGYTIGVRFDGPVDVGIAQEPSGYYFDPPFDGVVVSTATLKPGDPTRVLLTLDPLSVPVPIYGDFTLYADYMKDVAGNEGFGLFATGAVQRLTAKDIYLTSGNVAGGYNLALPGSTWTDTNGGFDVSANGYDIWNTADGFHFTYREVSGNFDIKTRINKLVGADQWSKAGIMARASTNANSRMMFMCAVPTTTPVAGQIPNNFFAAQYRDVDGGAPGNVQNTVPPSYPNAAVRLQRSNSVFYGYWSTNGTDGPWTLLLTRDTATLGAFPDTLQVGLATTSHDQTRNLNNNAYAEYRDLYFPPGAVITQQPQPTEATITIGINQVVTFSNLLATGNGVRYQWRRNGTAVAGGTNADFTIADTSVSDSGTYSASASTDGGGQISSNIYLVVTNGILTATNDLLTATQNVVYTFPTTLLTGNDFDPEGDPLTILALYNPSNIATNFNGGSLAGASLFNRAHWTNGVGAAGVSSGALVLNDAENSVLGSMLFNPVPAGATNRVLAFKANFKLRISDGTAEPADGFSFNFAADLPSDGSAPNAAEQGVGTGISFCVDNYRFAPLAVGAAANAPGGGTANTSGIKIQYGGIILAGIQTPVWNRPDLVPVSVAVDLYGNFTVDIDGTNAFTRTLPWVPVTGGKFGFYGRDGNAFESHWIDDLDVTVIAEGTATARGGVATLSSGGNITYTPPTGACGNDSFYYLASDGQLYGTNFGQVTVNILTTNGPTITSCVPSQNISAGASCTALLPDLRGQLIVADCGNVTITQSPAPGTVLSLGPQLVTFSVTNTSGLGTNCEATITVVDTTPPVAICPGNMTNEATSASGAAVTFSISGTDNCSVSSVVAVPASGSTFPIGVTTVTVTATDAAGNTNACTFTVRVRDTTGPSISCPANQLIACTSTNGATATYSASATDAVDPSPTVIVTPISGSTFSVGTNAVLVTAYDASGNTNTCTFNVVVQDQTPATLTITKVDTNAIVCWPQTCTTYTLENTTNLAPPIAWSPVGLPVDVAGTNYCVTVPITNTNTFFRLHKP